MFQEKVPLVTLDDIYKECLFLITSKDGKTAYCLKFKLWNEPCPKLCDQFIPQNPGQIEEAKQANYDFECLDFTRRIAKGSPDFYCTLYNLAKPLCKECLFHRYTDNPSTSEE